MVTCSSDSSIKVWDLTTRRKSDCSQREPVKKKKQDVVVATLNNHTDYVKALAYSPAQTFFASGFSSLLSNVTWSLSLDHLFNDRRI